MKIVYDDIIYSLQVSGGGSVYWSEVTGEAPTSAQHIIYDTAASNIFLNKEILNRSTVLSSCLLSIKRFLAIRLKARERFIFHSSYYRFCINSNAVNITTVHDFTDELYTCGLKAFLRVNRKKRAMTHSQGIICISENTKRDFLHFYPNYKNRLIVISNGYDNKSYYYEPEVKKTKNILFVGSRHGYKRFDLTLQIANMLKDCRLIIIGGGDLNREEHLLLEKTIPGRFEKKGFVANDDLRHLYNEAFFLCYPSEYEGFGIPIIESQACGCPVVCQSKASIPEVAGDAAIYINGSKIAEDVSLIHKLYDADYYSRIQKNGLENVKRFSWDKCRGEVQDFYKSIYEKGNEK